MPIASFPCATFVVAHGITIPFLKISSKGMHMPPSASKCPGSTCRCPSCSPQPSYNYSEEFKFECMAREFGHYSDAQREEFLGAMKRQKGWETRLSQIEAMVVKLKDEGRYETEFWKAKARSKDNYE